MKLKFQDQGYIFKNVFGKESRLQLAGECGGHRSCCFWKLPETHQPATQASLARYRLCKCSSDRAPLSQPDSVTHWMCRASCFKLHQPTAKYYWHGEQLQFCIPVCKVDNFSNRVEASLYCDVFHKMESVPEAIRATVA